MRYEWDRNRRLLRDGAVVGTAARSWWGGRATITTGAGSWSIRTEGRKRLMVTGPDGTERVGAIRTGRVAEVWTVTGDHATYEVRPGRVFRSRLAVRVAGAEVGQLTTARWW